MRFQSGDIFIIDSASTESKIIKFLMQSYTIWHWVLGKLIYLISKKKIKWLIDDVRAYHPGLVVNEMRVIEQQKVVEYESIASAFLYKPHVVYRNTSLTEAQRNKLVEIAERDLGLGYDVLLIVGKLLTWLTGIGWFARICQLPKKEICVTRLAKWFSFIGINFNKESWHEVTTDDIDDFCRTNTNWKVISETL